MLHSPVLCYRYDLHIPDRFPLPGAENIHIRCIAYHDTFSFFSSCFYKRIFKNFGMRFQTVGTFGSDHFQKKIVNARCFEFMMLSFFKTICNEMKLIFFFR